MNKNIKMGLLIAAAFYLWSLSPTFGASIELLYDSAYVDTSDSPTYGEAFNVKTALENKGHSVTDILDATTISPSYPGVDVLFIPEQDIAQLAGEIMVADYVNSGGCLIITGGSESGKADRAYSFLNDTFGFSLIRRSSGDSSGSTSYLSTDAVMTEFDGGPVSLNIGNNIPINQSIKTSSLPPEGVSVYTNNATTQVAIIPYGSGQIIYLSYDWYEAVPNGATDGGWDNVLERAIAQAGSSTGSADLSISLLSAPGTPKEGDFMVYTMTVTNPGPSDAQSVAITNYYPSNMAFYSGSSTHGECFGGGGEVLCELYTLTSGEVATVTIQFAAEQEGIVTNLAVLTSATTDPVTNNNSVSSICTITSGASNQADLQVSSGVETNLAETGDWVWFTATVTNAGPDGALNTLLSSDVLDPSLASGVSSIPDHFEFFFSNGVSYCDIGPLPAGASVTMNALATRTDPGIVSNVFTVTTSSSDPVLTNNQSVAHYTAVAPPTDLRLSSVPTHQLAEVGEIVSYALSVTNAGPEDANSVVVTNELPTNVAFSGATSSQGSCTNVGNLVVCSLGTLLPGNTAELTIDATAVSVGVQTNRASVSMTAEDTNPNNNSVLNLLETVPVTDLQLSMSQTTANPLYQGQHFDYVVTISNAGVYTAVDVIVSNPLPNNAVFISATSSQGVCSQNGTWLECSLGPIAAGSSATLTVELASVVDETVSNNATVSSATSDPEPLNNSATLLTGIIHGDTDDDGIADWWELHYFASLSSMTTNSDSDSNGLTDLEEWTSNSNPTNPLSVFAIDSVGPVNPFIFYWDAVPSRDYDIYWSSNLLSGFELLATNVAYPQNSYTDTVHAAENIGIYKIDVRMKDYDPVYEIEYKVTGFTGALDQGGPTYTFIDVSGRSNVVFSIRDNQMLNIPDFQSYTFTDISVFGYASFNQPVARKITLNDIEISQNTQFSGQVQPGWVNMTQVPAMTWDLDYGGDRKQLSMTILAAGGSGTHSGYIPASATMSEVLDAPVAIISEIGAVVHSADGLTLDATRSYDPDSTGHIDNWEWDLDYDAITFDIDLSGPYLEMNTPTLQSTYLSGSSYTIALRVTDSSGATNVTTTTMSYMEP